MEYSKVISVHSGIHMVQRCFQFASMRNTPMVQTVDSGRSSTVVQYAQWPAIINCRTCNSIKCQVLKLGQIFDLVIRNKIVYPLLAFNNTMKKTIRLWHTCSQSSGRWRHASFSEQLHVIALTMRTNALSSVWGSHSCYFTLATKCYTFAVIYSRVKATAEGILSFAATISCSRTGSRVIWKPIRI